MIFHDTHVHLDLLKYRQDAIRNLKSNKVYSIAVTNLPTIFHHNKITIPESKYIKHALGYHPELVQEYPDLLPVFKKELKRTRYIGEIGIDGSSRNRESVELQEKIFSSIVSLSSFTASFSEIFSSICVGSSSAATAAADDRSIIPASKADSIFFDFMCCLPFFCRLLPVFLI